MTHNIRIAESIRREVELNSRGVAFLDKTLSGYTVKAFSTSLRIVTGDQVMAALYDIRIMVRNQSEIPKYRFSN